MIPLWYWVGAGLWVFCAGIGYVFAGVSLRRRFARGFFAFPIWPAAVGWLVPVALAKLWKSAEWGNRSRK